MSRKNRQNRDPGTVHRDPETTHREPDLGENPPKNAPSHACTVCGSLRTVLIKTEPMDDGEGRREYRRCKSCLQRFWGYNRVYRRRI